ncbi:TPA: hypothetical protein QC216_004995 [Bacillus cereus]|uniref:preATP grasp domain-containing protein n=1 Tax=Bacillus cereus TaxID=1396 RepID=UPI000BEB3CC6|nr:hypothetical protein [Bacillus cereus]PEB33797.1 hypothetical protein COM77_22980 [Bacillus cereus]PGZ47097.1 hypothetical protein COE57_25535 [Bacillus cereus]HDR7762299.1 hypothetical protein [Bacillus cereus]HDR8344009.1 hypothetical protein [Bacillus cereus]HDR8353404.1 hypothetical protein [Bacillus cereus]
MELKIAENSVNKTFTLNKYPKLIIGNVGAESLVGEPDKLSEKAGSMWSSFSYRLAWLLEKGDILLLPKQISKEFLTYILSIKGLQKEDVHIIVPENVHHKELLTYETLNNNSLKEKLTNLMSGKTWDVIPYFFDRAVAQLVKDLPVKIKPHILDYFRQGGSEVLNSKIEYRRIAGAYDIPVPEGLNCYTPGELYQAIKELIDITGSVIIKQDTNASGQGNIVITYDQRTESPGAYKTLCIKQESQLEELYMKIWSDLTGELNTKLVVEAYYETVSVFYAELEVKEGTLRPYLLNFGDMRMEPVWNGFEIPTVSLKPYAIGEFVSNCTKLTEIVMQRGYIGLINIDGILTSDGKVMISEINGRTGGSTHVHVVAEHLYGENYGDNFTILTQNKVNIGNKGFGELLNELKINRLLASKNQEGVVLLNDENQSKSIEYMIIGETRERAYDLENNFRKFLNQFIK